MRLPQVQQHSQALESSNSGLSAAPVSSVRCGAQACASWPIGVDERGEVDIDELKKKAEENKDKCAPLLPPPPWHIFPDWPCPWLSPCCEPPESHTHHRWTPVKHAEFRQGFKHAAVRRPGMS